MTQKSLKWIIPNAKQKSNPKQTFLYPPISHLFAMNFNQQKAQTFRLNAENLLMKTLNKYYMFQKR
jgi:hypothetical protein